MIPMKSVTALANKAYTSILGALGRGASGSPSGNNLSQTNAAPIGPGATVEWDSSAFVSGTGKVLVVGTISVAPGTLADGDAVTVQIFRDGTTPVGGTSEVGAVTATGSVKAFGVATFIDTPAPGASHTYGVRASIGGGHTAQILTGDATIVVVDL
jgi:hypothetical protein